MRYALKLGTTGFGGPVALVGYMYRDLVEQRQWISESEYREGLALAQLAPGVTAAAIGTIAGAVIVLGQRSIIDVATASMALASLAILWKFKRVPEPLLVVAAALAGVALFPFARH